VPEKTTNRPTPRYDLAQQRRPRTPVPWPSRPAAPTRSTRRQGSIDACDSSTIKQRAIHQDSANVLPSTRGTDGHSANADGGEFTERVISGVQDDPSRSRFVREGHAAGARLCGCEGFQTLERVAAIMPARLPGSVR